jgi:hypothetical protein
MLISYSRGHISDINTTSKAEAVDHSFLPFHKSTREASGGCPKNRGIMWL